MKPIENVGQAIAAEVYSICPGSRPNIVDREKLARAALMALAEADLPREAEGRELSIMDHAVFRAMLRTIFRDCDQ
jgi:hypothetical protein